MMDTIDGNTFNSFLKYDLLSTIKQNYDEFLYLFYLRRSIYIKLIISKEI